MNRPDFAADSSTRLVTAQLGTYNFQLASVAIVSDKTSPKKCHIIHIECEEMCKNY